MAAYDKVLLLEERVKRAVAYIGKLRAENEALKRDIKLISGHNEELQSYVDNYKEDEERINQSIQASLESLNEVGLDNIDLTVADLETAEQFSAIGGDALELGDLDLSNLEL